jgi:hypothetical protein
LKLKPNFDIENKLFVSYGITRHHNIKGAKSTPSTKLYKIFKKHFNVFVVNEYKTT